MNIAVLASHGGSDLQAIINGCKSNRIGANVAVVISNNGDSFMIVGRLLRRQQFQYLKMIHQND